MRDAHSVIPVGTLRHLAKVEVESEWELATLARLLELGFAWEGLALPASFEEGFYRLNNLPHQLRALYVGLDLSDPDEDIVEEAEPAAVSLLAQSYLLDENVDLLYDSLGWSGRSMVRRPGAGRGREVVGRRGALLAVKHVYQDDWGMDAVMARLALHGRLGLDARPVLVTPGPERPDEDLTVRASRALGASLTAFVGPSGALTRIAPA